MKKLLIGLCFLCAFTPSMAAGANKMTMVTYFPVKYVAYSQVDVMKQMDVGLTSACQMNLGCTADEGFNTGKSLRVNNLLKIAGGKLELNDAPAIEGSTAHIGSGNGVGDFDFETNLRIGNYKQGYTLQADNMYLNELNLFGYKFPKCEGETMSWQKLKLKNKEEVYLVCGEIEKIKDECEPSAIYEKSEKEILAKLYNANKKDFCAHYNKPMKYSCPSNLTEKKECIDGYFEREKGNTVKGTYAVSPAQTRFTIPHLGVEDYSRRPSNIIIGSITTMEQFFPKYDSQGTPYTGYMAYNNSTEMYRPYGPGSGAVIESDSGTVPSYKYASSVDHKKFETSCKTFASTKDPGRYLMYTGGLLSDNSGDWYIITAGVCVVTKSDQYYKANVTCCPQQ